MNITLRKASVLQNTINEAIRGIEVKSEITLTEFHNPEAELARASAEVKISLTRRNALVRALYEIRKAVADVNHTSGVNNRLTDVAELEKQIQFYTGIVGKEVVENLDVIKGKLEKLRTTDSKSRIYGYGDTVSTSVFTLADIVEFKKSLSELKKAKQALQDVILEANVRNEITLSGTVVTILQAEGLL
jgi:hypothetical protein